jgi:hypothetical protein
MSSPDDESPPYRAASAVSPAVTSADELSGAVSLAIEELDLDDELASLLAAGV